MKKSKFSDGQIMEALKCVEAGLAVPELCREVGISMATFSKWCAKFGGMDTIPDGPDEGIRRGKPAPQEDVYRGKAQDRNCCRVPCKK